MENNNILKQMSLNMVSNSDVWIDNLRDNLRYYLSSKNITMHELAEIAGVSYETFKSFMYGKHTNCKLDPIIKIAKALHVSLDELVGANTLSDQDRLNIAHLRCLPAPAHAYVDWGINSLWIKYNATKYEKKAISIIKPILLNDGNIKISYDFDVLDISDMPDDKRSKIFVGMQMPCDHYMPHYGSYDTLLLANDRPARNNEHVVIVYGGYVWIAKHIDKNYHSIRDNKFRVSHADVEEVVGYVVDKITVF